MRNVLIAILLVADQETHHQFMLMFKYEENPREEHHWKLFDLFDSQFLGRRTFCTFGWCLGTSPANVSLWYYLCALTAQTLG